VIPAGPYTLALNVRTQLEAPDVHVRAIILENHSPFDCSVETQGLQKWLAPFTQDVYPTSGADSVIITPKLTLSAGKANTLLATWMQEGDPIPQGLPVTLTADAIAGAIASLGVADVPLTGSPVTVALAGNPSLALPAGAPNFDNLFIGMRSGGGFTASMAGISVSGNDSNIGYLPRTIIQPSKWITCPFSSLIDPSGITLAVDYPNGPGATGAQFYVIGQTNPTTVRALTGGATALSGPTNYASATANAAVLVPTNTFPQTIIRVWSAWVSGINAAGGGSGEVSIAATGVYILSCLVPPAVAGGSGTFGSNSVVFPGGVPVNIGAGAVTLIQNVGAARSGIAWSWDAS
jgi:hypothetical protein